ncbi:acetate--CoA ligase family protein [Mesobacillus harenae]|uniref:acetate--CoA ligase family protein n=1 Tax=Mesobacillus harenae TaxID=2213203 RepID=UPI0015800358|nr:acetate--CoA ligase family protein [Mesobacillus harenae]
METAEMQTIILNEIESRQLLEDQNINLNKYAFTRTKEEAVNQARTMQFPLVMKVVSPVIVHKSDFGGVQVGLKTVEEVEQAYDRIYENAARKGVLRNEIEGVVVQEMIEGVQEILVGIKRDPIFGPVLVIGIGGIFVELFKDVQLGICPLTEEDVSKMIEGLKGFPLLNGFRGRKQADVNALISLSQKVSAMAMENEQIVEMDLNPVILKENGYGAVAVDARIVLKQ